MNQLVDEGIPESDLLTDVKSEQIRLIFVSTPSSLIAILLCSFILSVVQWDVIDHFMIIVWFGLTNLLSLVRLYLYQQFVKLPAESLVGDSWYQGAINTRIASAITWGAGGFLLFAEQSWSTRFFWHSSLPACVPVRSQHSAQSSMLCADSWFVR